jgi:hemerythrin superfamily protein
MDALELLAEDHKLVTELFENMEAAEDEKEKRKIFREIKTELDTHARLEEAIFYPAMKERSELKEMVAESLKAINDASHRTRQFIYAALLSAASALQKWWD